MKYKIYLCDRKEIESFIEKWHYSKSINGVLSTFCFKLMDGDEIIGAAIFGRVGMANAWKKYSDSANSILELRRLCCIDNTERNTESFFIGKCLRILRTFTTIKTIISYADNNYGHIGTIYKASNFSFEGVTSQGKIIDLEGRQYHDKAIRTKYKGELKPFAKRLKDALTEGRAVYKKTLSKNIYTYSL